MASSPPTNRLRTVLATRALRAASRLSRAPRLGSGSTIGGRVGLFVDPDLLDHLGRARRVALLTGTNGKTTTLLVEAPGAVAFSGFGVNMPAGLVNALAHSPAGAPAVLEVDERYLEIAAHVLDPAVIVLRKLSRDQLDQMSEVRMVAARWRQTRRTATRSLWRTPTTRSSPPPPAEPGTSYGSRPVHSGMTTPATVRCATHVSASSAARPPRRARPGTALVDLSARLPMPSSRATTSSLPAAHPSPRPPVRARRDLRRGAGRLGVADRTRQQDQDDGRSGPVLLSGSGIACHRPGGPAAGDRREPWHPRRHRPIRRTAGCAGSRPTPRPGAH
ncbi:MAG TPA: hypothetical protein VED84_00915 [Acidimicrobiales bacterium]|nr:hypothetical protein [Acidimicrobiales bacterium]